MKRSKSQREATWKPPELTHAQILAWADAYHERTGRWPSVALRTLPIPDSSGEQWRALDWPKARCEPQLIEDTFGEVWFNVDQALRKGLRGLPGQSSLARLLARHRDVPNPKTKSQAAGS